MQHWFERPSTATEDRAFVRLQHLSSLNEAWAKSLQRATPLYTLPEVTLGGAPARIPTGAEPPLVALQQIEERLWDQMAEFLGQELTPKRGQDPAIALGQLEQTTWNHGRTLSHLIFSSPERAQPELAAFAHALLWLWDSPTQNERRSVVTRLTHSELCLEMGFCPHHSQRFTQPDSACRLLQQWMKGLAYGTSTRFQLKEATHHASASSPAALQMRWALT